MKEEKTKKIRKSGDIELKDHFRIKGKKHTVYGIISGDETWLNRKVAVWDENGDEYDINDVELRTRQVSLGKDRNGKSLLVLDEEMLALIGVDTGEPFSRRQVARKLKKFLTEKVEEAKGGSDVGN